MTTITLFDWSEAQRQRDAAIQRVGDAADQDYMRIALQVVAELARSGAAFTTDDVIARMPDGVSTHEPRALGAVMRRAQRAGIVEPTNSYRNSTMTTCHGRPKRLWRGVV